MDYKMSYPAITPGAVVTEGHAQHCAQHGHATHTVDGVISPFCPRCGDATAPAAPADMLYVDHVEPNVALGLVRDSGAALYISRADGRSAWIVRDSETDAVVAQGRTLKLVAVRAALALGCTEFEIDKEF